MEGLVNAYRGRRVLVTGHTGFKGGWLAFWLASLGAEVTGFGLDPETDPSFFAAADLAGALDHRVGDLCDPHAVGRVFSHCRPEFVFHLAAQALVRRSHAEPLRTFETNVMGTARLLDAVRTAGRPCTVIVATSDKCYENRESGRAFAENDPLGGRDPYSASKAGTELVAAAYRNSYFPAERVAEHGVTLATVRAGNVIGGGDWATDRIVCDMVRALAAGDELLVRNPDAVRPWQHVADALAGYLWLGTRMAAEPSGPWSSAWNFGPPPGPPLTVRQLVETLLARWGSGTWRHVPQAGAPAEARQLVLDPGRAMELLDWRPVWDMNATVEKTVDWYRAHAEGAAAATLTLEQIQTHGREAATAGRPWAAARASLR